MLAIIHSIFGTPVCKILKETLTPSQAQNVTVISYDLPSATKISLNFSWTPPLFPNGILTTYTACVSQTALLSNEEPVPNSGRSFCEHDIEVSIAKCG